MAQIFFRFWMIFRFLRWPERTSGAGLSLESNTQKLKREKHGVLPAVGLVNSAKKKKKDIFHDNWAEFPETWKTIPLFVRFSMREHVRCIVCLWVLRVRSAPFCIAFFTRNRTLPELEVWSTRDESTFQIRMKNSIKRSQKSWRKMWSKSKRDKNPNGFEFGLFGNCMLGVREIRYFLEAHS